LEHPDEASVRDPMGLMPSASVGEHFFVRAYSRLLSIKQQVEHLLITLLVFICGYVLKAFGF
jgi:hypothetical protein